MVRGIPLAFSSVLLLAGCTVGERPTLSAETVPSTLASSPTEQGDEGSATMEGPIELGEPLVVTPADARALITPTGVIVPVLAHGEDGFTVHTPCGVETLLAWGTPILGADVVLDPGHGGDVETGAVGPNGLQEKDLNLTLAKRAATILSERGIVTVLTRTADYRIPLSTRAEIGNRLEAEVMVSIHHNAPNWLPSDTPGTEIFVQDGSRESRRLGGLIWEEVVDALDQFDIEWTTNDDAGALVVLNDRGENSYGMVRRPEMPAVLAEFGYLSNAPEAELFATDEYIEVAATALADALERWLDTPDPGSGFVDEPRIFTPNGLTGGSNGCVDPALE